MNTDILSNLIDNMSKMSIRLVFFVPLVVFNATYTNISVISWRSALLLEETGGHGENHQPVSRDTIL